MLAEIEQELVALIKASPLASRLREVATMPELTGDTLIKKLASMSPAIYAAPEPIQVSSGVMTVRYGLACVARNARGHEAARHGDACAIGLYPMLELLAGLLDGAMTDSISWSVIGVDYMRDDVLFRAGVQVGSVRIEGRVMLPPAIDESLLADFKTFHADIDIPPHESTAEHNKWKTGDYSTSAPDLQDTLTLPQN